MTKPTKLIYGDGLLQTQQGKTADGLRCITIRKKEIAQPIGSSPAQWEKLVPENQIDVILAFKNLESARTLQDELNELIAIWSRELGTVV